MAESLLHIPALANGHGFAHPKRADASAIEGRMEREVASPAGAIG
jgi:hypothetical protein